jgi:hypothetical protein
MKFLGLTAIMLTGLATSPVQAFVPRMASFGRLQTTASMVGLSNRIYCCTLWASNNISSA